MNRGYSTVRVMAAAINLLRRRHIDNFVLESRIGVTRHDRVYFGSVRVEVGFLFWKKTRTLKITRRYGGSWCSVESGEVMEPIHDFSEACTLTDLDLSGIEDSEARR